VVVGDDVIIETGGGQDQVEVGVSPLTGQPVVVVNGVATRYPRGANLVIRTGDGNDEVVVAPGTRIRVTLYGGPGDDVLRGGDGDDLIHGEAGNDRIHLGGGNDVGSGGAGRDYIDAGTGDDTVTGGRGNDTVYGLDGDDRISGGGGNDYADGGAGDDRVDGGRGNDTASGGRGDDTVRGGPGDDHIYAGPGRDTVDGEGGTDTAYGEADDTLVAERVVIVELRVVGTTITIEGSPAFVDRVRADLDLLRSSPRGQAMLAALDAAGGGRHSNAAGGGRHSNAAGGGQHSTERARRIRSRLAAVPVIGRLVNQGDTLTIAEYVSPSRAEDNSFAHRDVERLRRGRQMLVEYQTDLDHVHDGPPITVLYHELAHVYDYAHGTTAEGTYAGADNPGADNAERVATGLPIDHDRDPSTPDRLDPRHPYDCTENALREEMGVRKAPGY
jgi:Ca2+-binding RTX toxin-like protein